MTMPESLLARLSSAHPPSLPPTLPPSLPPTRPPLPPTGSSWSPAVQQLGAYFTLSLFRGALLGLPQHLLAFDPLARLPKRVSGLQGGAGGRRGGRRGDEA